eukprot:9914137-Lingulodinium_polyedra.AAC.1
MPWCVREVGDTRAMPRTITRFRVSTRSKEVLGLRGGRSRGTRRGGVGEVGDGQDAGSSRHDRH